MDDAEPVHPSCIFLEDAQAANSLCIEDIQEEREKLLPVSFSEEGVDGLVDNGRRCKLYLLSRSA
eukprot:jgi/Psemu1/47889/gm1.47889_g